MKESSRSDDQSSDATGKGTRMREAQAEVPVAQIEQATDANNRRWKTRVWWSTGICAVVAIALMVANVRDQGRLVTVHFRNGHGIKPGDALRFRGIDVGQVERVELDKERDGVDVAIRLPVETTSLAVDGSKFWIERPRLRIGQVSGLETVLGAKFVGVLPGPDPQRLQSSFQGIEMPLQLADADELEIRVRFPAGEGLEIGDPVRYLGINVGEVTYVDLSESLDHVWIGCRLVGAAQQLAKSGTQFWIERPRLDVSEIRGLDTLIGGRYLAMEPLSANGESQFEFVGIPEAPPLRRREGSLELELEAPSRMGLVRGAPVSYRGLEVGRVADVRLASDGVSVEVQLIIEPEYADLVRDNSTWWSTGGIKFDAGLTGIQLSVDSFAAWLRGGVSFATPNSPGKKVATGHHFALAESPRSEWLAWQPRIAAGTEFGISKSSTALPRPVRIATAWESSWFGLARRKSAQSWALPLDDGMIIVPSSVLQAAAASKRPVTLEVGGKSLSIEASAIPDLHGLSRIKLATDIKLATWPVQSISKTQWGGKSTLLIVNPELTEPMPLDASRVMRSAKHSMTISSDVPIPESLVGSPVMDSSSGELCGMLAHDEDRWKIVVIPVE